MNNAINTSLTLDNPLQGGATVNAGAIARLFAAPPIFKKTGYQAGSLIIFRMAQGPPVSTHYRATLLRLNPLLHQAEK